MKIRYSLVFLLLISYQAFSQISNTTFSPYSMFGLGRYNENNTGVTNSLGRSGVALASEYEINGLNPASLAAMGRTSFFFDIGLKAEYDLYANRKESNSNETLYNFTNISFAFPVGKKSAFSISLMPYTEVGYFFKGIVTDVEGSSTGATSTIVGKGGLNNFNINYGRQINSKLSLGIAAKYYFGTINQTEYVTIDSDLLSIEDKNYYKGVRFETGLQYLLSDKLSLGGVVSFPTILSGSKDREVSRLESDASTVIDQNNGVKLDDYNIPLEVTAGIKYKFKDFSLITDYKRTFWSSAHMADNIGKYVDSNVLGLGLEYFKKKTIGLKTKPGFRYRLGFNYDDGNLEVKKSKISNSLVTAGLGIPFGKNTNTFMNISYSFGSKGFISNTLIRENYHAITINLSFEDLWFQKRLFD
ncbi:MAG: hypothetical protein QM710_03505 [Flavobacterium sp.]